MQFRYRYFGETQVDDSAAAQSFSFAPDTLRPPTFFDGTLRSDSAAHWQFREAMSALHSVVVSDQRYRGRDLSVYKRWLADNESSLLAQFMQRAEALKEKAQALSAELQALRQRKNDLLQPFYQAQRKYFDWLYQANRDAWYVLDPVITVHPERLLFEAFSQDESSYCSVSVSHDVFERRGEMACGTTNIDYSASLNEEFQKIRDYKRTRLQIDPAGFSVATGSDPELREEKIDLPDSWVRGFLQVTSAMTLPSTVVELHPMDLHNLCAALRQHKERAGPRSLRFELHPQHGATMVLEPWNIRLPARRSRIVGGSPTQALTEPLTVRVWGRRRLLTLERLIAPASSVHVHLTGSGMPSFWVIGLDDITVTLGLSGWTSNDWASAGRFSLLQSRREIGHDIKLKIATELQQRWQATPAELASATGIALVDVQAAITLWVQAGRAVYDLATQRILWRELAREPLPLESLRFASEEESTALALIHAGGVKLTALHGEGAMVEVAGKVKQRGKTQGHDREHETSLVLDADDRLRDGRCTCNFHRQNALRRGPCAHMLALRQLAQPRVDARREALAKENA